MSGEPHRGNADYHESVNHGSQIGYNQGSIINNIVPWREAEDPDEGSYPFAHIESLVMIPQMLTEGSLA